MDFLNYRTMSLPLVYLGIPIGANHRKKDTWSPIVDKFHKKLATRKHRHLSFPNRVYLINQVISYLPLFFYPFLKLHWWLLISWLISKGISFWGCKEGRWKIVWVSWKKICCPRSHGGLRIKDINLFNNALLGKWRQILWEKGSFWSDGRWCRLLQSGVSNRTSLWWRDFKKVCGEENSMKWFDSCILGIQGVVVTLVFGSMGGQMGFQLPISLVGFFWYRINKIK